VATKVADKGDESRSFATGMIKKALEVFDRGGQFARALRHTLFQFVRVDLKLLLRGVEFFSKTNRRNGPRL